MTSEWETPIRELSGLRHGRDAGIVTRQLGYEAAAMTADKALFRGDPKLVAEMLTRCPVPARFAMRCIDQFTSKTTIAFDLIDIWAPILGEAAANALEMGD